MMGQRAQLGGGASVQDCGQIKEDKRTRPDGGTVEGERERVEGRKGGWLKRQLSRRWRATESYRMAGVLACSDK
jgi:hypothetical protein